jgi:hypothetical protein
MENAASATAVPGPQTLVLVGCSRKKVTTPGMLPAIERYDGPVFRLLRRFLHTAGRPVCIQIVSAAYGLIPANRPIPWYDCQMTAARATILRPAVSASLQALADAQCFADIYVAMGSIYRRSLPDCTALMPGDVPVHIVSGSLGRQLSVLHDGLYGGPPASASHGMRAVSTVRLRGIERSIMAAEALAAARQALAAGSGRPFAFQSWYVALDCERVAPKWLVGLLFGLPVSAFTSDEARRVLASIGIPVVRT